MDMRTPIILDPDLQDRVKSYMRDQHVSLKRAVNALVRMGLEVNDASVAPHEVSVLETGGLQPGITLDCIHVTLEAAEGAEYR